MLTNPYPYKTALIEGLHSISDNPAFMYYFADGDPSFQAENIACQNKWHTIERASIQNLGKPYQEAILGYLRASINRSKNNAISAISAINFDPRGSIMFAKDLMAFYDELFVIHKCSKINWDVCAASTHCNSYKRLCEKWGGRVFGPFKKDFKCWNGEIHDAYKFEITSEEFFNAVKTNNNKYQKLRRINAHTTL